MSQINDRRKDSLKSEKGKRAQDPLMTLPKITLDIFLRDTV